MVGSIGVGVATRVRISARETYRMGRLQWQCIILVSLIAFSTATANGNGKINMKIYCYDSPGMPYKKPLHISPDNGKFRIALFADLHYGENSWTDWGPAQDNKSDKLVSVILDVETPDFVVYLANVITANNIPVGNASLYWERALSPTRNRGIPWASVFGNHDDMPFEWPSDWFSSSGIPQIVCPQENTLVSGEDCTFKGTTRLELMAGENTNNMGLSYSDSGPRKLWPGVSNYVLQVGSAKDPKSAVSFMYFLDSGGGSYPEVISDSQVKWFQTQSEILNPDSVIPEIIFWHIPSISYKSVAPSSISGIQKPCVGSTNDENVAAQEAEWGMMDILSNRSSVKAIFVGHNHALDWCCPSENLWLCFARHTGYGGYGNWPRGARILEITEQPFSLKSWIRMENGTMHGYVELD